MGEAQYFRNDSPESNIASLRPAYAFAEDQHEVSDHRCSVQRADFFDQASDANEVLARMREAEESEKRADEARIAELRAEVDFLRLHQKGTPHPGLVLDASLSGLDP